MMISLPISLSLFLLLSSSIDAEESSVVFVSEAGVLFDGVFFCDEGRASDVGKFLAKSRAC